MIRPSNGGVIIQTSGRWEFAHRAIFVFVIFYLMAFFTEVRLERLDSQYFSQLFDQDYPTSLAPGELRLGLITLALLLCRSFLRSVHLVDPVVWMLIFWAAISVLWSLEPYTTASQTANLLLVSIFLAYYLQHFGVANLLTSLWFFGASIIFLTSILAPLGSDFFLMRGVHDGLWRGPLSHKNSYGSLVAAFLLLTIFGKRVMGLGRNTWFCALLVGFLNLSMAGSATASTAFIISLFTATFMRVGLSLECRSLALLIISLFMASISLAWLPILEFVVGLFDRSTTFTGRLPLWEAGASAAQEKFWGHGFGTGGGQFTVDMLRRFSTWDNARTVHNVFIQKWLDLGLGFAILFVVWLLWRVFFMACFIRYSMQPIITGIGTFLLLSGTMEVDGGLYGSYELMIFLAALFSTRMNATKVPLSEIACRNPLNLCQS